MIYLLLIIFQLMYYSNKTPADWILYNGKLYTVDSSFSVEQAMAIKDGKIIETGSDEVILSKYTADKTDNLDGKTVYPGFIDAHCHFLNYGVTLNYSDLYGAKSFDEIIQTIKKHDTAKTGGWVIGRGWDQNLWDVKEFPDNKKLDVLFPNTPVYLIRIDGHAALANSKALELAGINAQTKTNGGIVEIKEGKCTGILLDNAMVPMEKILPINQKQFVEQSLLEGQKNCFAVGLTSVQDAGLDPWQINLIKQMQDENKLKMRMYVMISGSDSNQAYFFKQGKIKTPYLNVSSFKFYSDGALGSRGAALLTEYSDDKNNTGLLFYSFDSLQRAAQKIYDNGFQMCTHAIGDAANRQVLDIYASILKGKNNYRWRIEHCQVVNKNDFSKFGQYSIIPSIQTTHATSDMNWAGNRLQKERLQYAYAYQNLLQQNGVIANGSDFPVEDINPLFGFYAGISRKNREGFPASGFQMENAITRMQALKAMTVWAAYAAFEENEKGSLEKNKFADFVILNKDIMQIPEAEILSAKVLITVVNGEVMYQK